VSGLLKACEKRPIKPADIDDIADRAEQLLNDRPEREISGRELGALVMSELKKLDQVAYVRFASVYRDFRDVDDFAHEVRALKGHKE
jgi:transcriptional repressor NrdR